MVPGCIDENLSLTIEHPCHRVAGAQISAVAAERMADLGHGPIRIVGGCLDEDGGSPRSVAFVGQLLVDAPLELPGPLLNGAIDVLARHVDRLGSIDGGPEPGVTPGITTARPGGYRDLPDDLGPGRCALGVGNGLLAFDLFPLAVAGHGRAPWQRELMRFSTTVRGRRNISATPACGNAATPLESASYATSHPDSLLGRPAPLCLSIGAAGQKRADSCSGVPHAAASFQP